MKIGVEKVDVALFVVRVVRDILGLIAIENFQGPDIAGRGRIDASQLGVLLPQVCLDDLCGGEKLENRGVAFAQALALFFVPVVIRSCGPGQQGGARREKGRAEAESSQEGTAGEAMW
jgi:hypothetical protein